MHVYENVGGDIKPRHLVPLVKRPNELRPTRITDFRKWLEEGKDVAPSVTTILSVFDKPALMNWKIDQHLQQTIHIDKHDYHYENEDGQSGYYDIDSYIKEIKRLTEIEMDKAPSAGTDFHKLMEKAIIEYQSGVMPNELELKVIELIQEKTGCNVMSYWKPEINIYSDLGYAGQCDLFIPATENSHAWVLDYKTKQTADKFKPGKMAYWDSHLAQLMAYGMELDPTCYFQCANIFVCLETGDIDFHLWDDEKLKTKAWAYFQTGLEAWQLKNL